MPDGSGRALQALGLALRAGQALVGTRSVKDGLASGEVQLVVVAGDASDNALGRLEPGLGRSGVDVVRCADRVSLGAALGRGPVAVVGVVDTGLARKVEREARAGARSEDHEDREDHLSLKIE